MPASPDPYRGHRFPREVIAHTVRLYLRFALSFRDVEELRRREVRAGRTWHLDEMGVRIGGRLHWL